MGCRLSRTLALGCFLPVVLQFGVPSYGQGEARVLRFRELTETTSSAKQAPPAVPAAPSELKTPQPTLPQPTELPQMEASSAPLAAVPLEEAAPAPPPSVTPQPAPQRPVQQLSRPGLNSHALRTSQIEPQVTNQTRHALNFYGGQPARATLNQMPRREIQPNGGAPARPPVKPFQVVQRDPTVSPYMNLYHDDVNVESAPNYFAFVRPQMEQLEANRAQQYELHHLRGQVQRLSSTVAGPQYQSPAMPATGSRARFMDTAQFYNGVRR